ncbi:phosphatidylinositol N-acetylglucosaminyltransferase-domain-containing protein [Chiua virens]|nr:phosphatidylinositol N-acetylglucosaminyltransferase-domain-containing protein [Chiua virens]
MSFPWKRVLWETSHYPDNFIPPDAFLSALRRNPNFTPYTYWPLVFLCCAITQHIATVFVFLAIFTRLIERTLDARVLLWMSVTCSALGYAIWEILHTSHPGNIPPNRSKAFKSSLLVFLALMGLSPRLENSDRCDFLGLYMGIGISTALQALVTLSITVLSLILVTPLSTSIASIITGLYIAVTFIAPAGARLGAKIQKACRFYNFALFSTIDGNIMAPVKSEDRGMSPSQD